MAVNLDKWKARIARVPARVKQAAETALAKEAEGLVQAMKRAAPESKLDRSPGEFRDSIRAGANPRRELSVTIIADPKDADGHGFAPHVEFGHRARDGSHVPAEPSFFPTYRARRKGMKRRIAAATRKAAKAEWPR